jgi:hypothetical protein
MSRPKAAHAAAPGPRRKKTSQDPGAQGLRSRPDRARPQGRARSGHRPQERNPPRHPDPLPPHQEQSGAHRRGRRRQDRHRRGPRPGNLQRHSCPNPAEKKVITLDLALMVAGTKYRGQFEERIKAVMDEIKRAKNVIIFIDELHTIVGAGAAEGAMDASNIFKPALSRGELQCIGATTLNEYRKYIEKDSALDRRFQSVKVEAPSSRTRSHPQGHPKQVRGPPQGRLHRQVARAAVKLSDRYITSRFLPDKAIDVMDEAGARARIASLTRPPEIEDSPRRSRGLRAEGRAIAKQHFEEAAKFRDKEKQARASSEEVLETGRRTARKNARRRRRGRHDAVVADWTGIPLKRMEKTEARSSWPSTPSSEARSSARTADHRHRQGPAPLARRPQGPAPPDRLVHFPRPDRRRQDVPRQAAGRRCSATPGRDHPDRHVRVHGEVLRLPPDRLASGLRRLRGRRPAHRAVRRRPYSVVLFDESKRRTRTSCSSSSRSWRTAA